MRRLSNSASDQMKELLELRDLACKQLKQNLQKYNRLKQNGLCLSFTISLPTISKNTELKPKEINIQKLYLEGIMNKLMRDQEILSKQERKYIYETQEENQEKKEINLSIYKSYNYLRSAWTQFNKGNNEQVDDHLDRLNKTVAVLKGNLQKSWTSVKGKKVTFYTMEELLQCEEYQVLLRNYQECQMELEDTIQKYQSKMGQLETKNKRLEEEIKSVKKELQDMKCREIMSSSALMTNRPNIMMTSTELKPLFENPYFQVRIVKIPSDDSSYYAKCLNDLKQFVKNYNGSEESIKEQRATAIKNLHHFAKSQDITKVKFERIKQMPDNIKIPPEKFTKMEILRMGVDKLT